MAGELTLRGVTRAIAFPATLAGDAGGERRAGARFRIDRREWGIEYRWDPVRNELVDDEILIELALAVPTAPIAARSAGPRHARAYALRALR